MDKDIKPQNILQTISLEEMCVFNYDCVEFRLFLTENAIVTFL